MKGHHLLRSDESSRETVPWLDAFMRLWHYVRGRHGDDIGVYEMHSHNIDEGNFVRHTSRCLSCGALVSGRTVFPDQPWR